MAKSFAEKHDPNGPKTYGGTRRDDSTVLDEMRAELEDLKKRFSSLSSDVDESVKKAFQNRITNLEDAIAKNEPLTKSPQAQRLQQKQQTQQLRSSNQSKITQLVRDAAKTTASAPKQAASKAESSSDKLADTLLSDLKAQQQNARNAKLRLPQFTPEQATGIVIAGIFIIFFIEASLGTKFASLWHLAFTHSTSGSGTGDYLDSARDESASANTGWNLFHREIA